MAYKYSKLGYGNAEDVEAAIALGLIDGKDIIITKDTSEFIYVRDDLSIQKVAPRTLCFDSIPAANEEINQNDATYAGQTVMIRGKDDTVGRAAKRGVRAVLRRAFSNSIYKFPMD